MKNTDHTDFYKSMPILPEVQKPSLATGIDAGQLEWITANGLKSVVDGYRASDDVFDDAFLRLIVVYSQTQSDIRLSEDVEGLLESWGTEQLLVFQVQKLTVDAIMGPALVRDDGLWDVQRLFRDTNEAFMVPLISVATPASDSGSVPPHAGRSLPELVIPSSQANGLAVAVPSRLNVQKSHDKPLAGFRVAVKDIFQLQGIKTSVCNRAYLQLYPEASRTASCINMIQAAGATIVGTTKLASFAATEEPTECVDFPAPWNPRGDGYQSPAGSSSGSAVAVTAYDWIDIGIGSDSKRPRSTEL